MTDRLFIETKILAEEDGAIEGLAWPFGSADRVGDIIEKGAFASATVPLPMLFGHDFNDPVGTWDAAEEAPDGLRLKGQLLIGEVARAREVQALVKAGAVRGLSVGFRTIEAAPRKGGRPYGPPSSSSACTTASRLCFRNYPSLKPKLFPSR